MDMYQKRKIRKEKRENSNQNEKFHKVVLNWYPGHMAKKVFQKSPFRGIQGIWPKLRDKLKKIYL